MLEILLGKKSIGGPVVEDKNGEVYRQYNIKIYNTYRTRGAILLETNQGIKLCKGFEGSKNRVEFENLILEHLKEQGYERVDLYVRNMNGELISEDNRGNPFIIKDWFEGSECSLRDIKDIAAAAGNLAVLHNHMNHVELTEEQIKYNTFTNLFDTFDKHNRELKRVRSYVRDKKQKNEFEICFLNLYDSFYAQGCESLDILKTSQYKEMLEEANETVQICHGNYTYHNIIMSSGLIAVTNFDKASIGVEILDLYHFLRKIMEKNNWNLEYAATVLEEYSKKLFLSKEKMKVLYVLLLYPEKFWKITNFYYNGRKSWIPLKNIHKLSSLEEQKKQKEQFLRYMEQQF